MPTLKFLAIVIALLPAFPSLAQEANPLAQYKWQARPLVIFADSPFDPRFKSQMKMLANDVAAIKDRDVVVMTDTDPAANGPLRKALHPLDFMFVLIGKDGTIALRKPNPWSARELSHAIDKMPIRIDEINAKRGLQD